MKRFNALYVLLALWLGLGSALPSLAQAPDFTWDNATVYFVLPDRFQNGDPSNDNSYGRNVDGNGNAYGFDQIGSFHGGDYRGLIQKLEEGYFDDLGINAFWVTAPYEQIHGWVSGSGGSFRHYAYHGYYPLDWSEMDANMGTKADFQEFVDKAHARGIRVLMDIVMNHTGYNSAQDMEEFGFGCIDPAWRGWRPNGSGWDGIHNFIDYNSSCGSWTNWWGPGWVRSGLPGYPAPGGDDKTMSLAGLPDVITEGTTEVGLPPVLLAKWNSAKEAEENAELNAFFARTGLPRTPRNYIIKWLTDWVREFGIDGYRVDTEKHVEGDAWRALKDESIVAFNDWKAANPSKVLDGNDFWMVGETFGYGYGRSDYHLNNGFDALINFDFQNRVGDNSQLESIFSSYAGAISADPDWNALSYISSHDTELYNRGNLINAGTGLLLLPGAVQIFYGDETARPFGPTGDDPHQGTRSFMNWNSINQGVLSHWQALGKFRRDHPAVGAGTHSKLADGPYTFMREYQNDKVIVAIGASGSTTMSVGAAFPDGTEVRDAYTGNTSTVSNGQVTFNAHSNGIILLEATSALPYLTLDVSPGNSYDPNSITVSMSADGDNLPATIYYTTDGSTPSTSSSVYSGSFTLTATTTVKAIAIDASGNQTAVVSRNYQIGSITGFNIYFKKPAGWGTPTIHHWLADPVGVIADSQWPGDAMTPIGDDWYTFSFAGVLSSNLIFSNNGAGQTEDFTRSSEGWYKDGVWYDQNPDGPIDDTDPPGLTVSQPGGLYYDEVMVILSAADVDPNPVIYYTLDGSMPTTASASATSSETFTFTADVTLKYFAVDNEGNTSAVETQAYDIEPTPAGMTVYYKNSSSWGSPTLYFWATTPVTLSTTWPGVTMADEGNGWYSHTLPGVTCASLIFSNNGGSQTGDLTRCGTGWYKDGTWYDQNPEGPDTQAPTVTADKATGTYIGSVTVTLTAIDNEDASPVIYYTTDGSTPTTSSTSAGSPVTLTFNSTTELKYFAVDAAGNASAVNTATYTVDPAPAGMTVYFKNSSNWNSPTVYFWATTPSSVSTSWPGAAMTSEGNGWYSYTLPGVTCSNVIFSDAGANQTADLYRCNTGWYKNGTWYNENPDIDGSDSFTVHFKPSGYSNPTIYFWNTTGHTTTWPGEAMTNEGNGWYSYTFVNVSCANVIFSNNGASQTADLNRCGEGWYTNGSWSSSAPTVLGNGPSEGISSLATPSAAALGSYPNPFSGSTTLTFSLPESGQVSLTLYDHYGRQVSTVMERHMQAGHHTLPYEASNLAPGMYVLRMVTPTEQQTTRLVVR